MARTVGQCVFALKSAHSQRGLKEGLCAGWGESGSKFRDPGVERGLTQKFGQVKVEAILPRWASEDQVQLVIHRTKNRNWRVCVSPCHR